MVFQSPSHFTLNEKQMFMTGAFINVAGVNDFPCAYAKDLDDLFAHSRNPFLSIWSTKHCSVVLRCWPDPHEFISCVLIQGFKSAMVRSRHPIVALMARATAAHALAARVSRRLNLPCLLLFSSVV